MIRYDDIHLDYAGKNIFSGFSLEVSENEKLLISGPSGCGKTSLFKILLGFTRISSGRVLYNDREVNARTIRAVRRNLFYLSQDIDFRNAPVNAVLDEVFSYEPNRGLVPMPANREHLMKMLDLGDDILRQDMQKLSGGERQRLGLLVCFLLNRPVWLLDEPTSSLDKKLRRKVVDYVMATGKTVLIVSHDDIWRKADNLKIVRWS